tara:strand:+ start:1784 stop:2314 length:531 start_codon:yes stop_codon:yes gene_type:complete
MPNARRVIFSSYVVPTKSLEMEETSVRHTEFLGSTSNDTLSKTLGGKGIASINATQWGDGWVSFAHQGGYWEDQGDIWNLVGETWGGELEITTTLANHQLVDNSISDDLAFLYIKNTGDTNNCKVSLTGSSGDAFIIIPPGGSVNLRGDGTNLDCNDVFVQSNTSTTTIEFIIAKE